MIKSKCIAVTNSSVVNLIVSKYTEYNLKCSKEWLNVLCYINLLAWSVVVKNDVDISLLYEKPTVIYYWLKNHIADMRLCYSPPFVK